MPAKPIIAIIALLAVFFAATQAQAAAARLVFLGTFQNPTFVGVAPGEPNLLFVVERPGVVRLLINEQRIATPFLDIRDLVLGQPDGGAGNEQGLLSIAFAPDYAQSQRFYVAFTNNNGSIEIDEFHRRAAGLFNDLGAKFISLAGLLAHESLHAGKVENDADLDRFCLRESR